MNIVNNKTDYIRYCYNKQLKRDVNKLGILMIVFSITSFALALILSFVVLGFSGSDFNSYSEFFQKTSYALTESGLVSLMIFFLVGIIYCLIRRLNLSMLLPFKKTKPKQLFLLCSVGLSICMVANLMTNIIMQLFDTVGIDSTVDMDYVSSSAVDVIVYYLTVAIIPAFVEEFAFRGIIIGSMRKYSDGFAILVSAILFGLMHGNFMQMPFAFVVGLILGLVYVKTNSMLPSMIIHFLNNGISVTFSVINDITNISDNTINIIYTATMLLICVTGLISAVILIKEDKDFFNINSDNDTNDILSFKEKIKTFCSSPTMIIFALFCVIESVFLLSFEGL